MKDEVIENERKAKDDLIQRIQQLQSKVCPFYMYNFSANDLILMYMYL